MMKSMSPSPGTDTSDRVKGAQDGVVDKGGFTIRRSKKCSISCFVAAVDDLLFMQKSISKKARSLWPRLGKKVGNPVAGGDGAS
jgi:hypothetical protein